MKVLVADKLASSVVEALEGMGCELAIDPDLGGDSLSTALVDFDPRALVVRSTKVTSEHMEVGKSLSLIVRAGAGINTIDVDNAADRAIFVCNTPGKNAIAVAELVIGHLINLDRRIADNVAALREGRWEKKRLGKARGLYGRTLALLGTGGVGREVAMRAKAMGMTVRAWDLVLTPKSAAKMGVIYCETALEACVGADALTVHVPLNTNTRGLVGDDLFAVMNDGAYIVNTARGGIVEESALRRAIAERDFRAGLDVFTNEPSSSANQFDDDIGANVGVYGTHHVGASTDQASDAVGGEVVRIVEKFLKNGAALNCVNLVRKPKASHVLVVRHADKIGVLASVLEKLCQAGVNVQGMENTIFRGATAASAHIQVSTWPEQELLDQVRATEHVFNALVIPIDPHAE